VAPTDTQHYPTTAVSWWLLSGPQHYPTTAVSWWLLLILNNTQQQQFPVECYLAHNVAQQLQIGAAT
jgi:hypothetical protein